MKVPGIIRSMEHDLAHRLRDLPARVFGTQGKRESARSRSKRSRIVSQIATALLVVTAGLAIGTAIAAPTSAAGPAVVAAPKVELAKIELAQTTGITYPREGAVGASPVDSKTTAKPRAEPSTVPMATDFAAHARRAASLDAPLIVLVSLRDCVYCGPIRQRELAPLVRSGKYEVREIGMDSRTAVRDFDGSTTTGVAWARAHGVKVSPTVLFLDTSGRPVADPLIGAGLPDFYGAYLDDAIARGRARLHVGSGATTR
ncbi:hypothetical protein [Pandoraea fibrosis]|nr:hypothetical protein [Pandoraea fibrosis]